MIDFRFLAKAELEALAAAFRSGKLVMPVNAFSLQRYISKERVEILAEQIAALSKGGFQEGQVALLFEALALQGVREGRATELATTGPDAPGVCLRDTSVVVRELFAKAKQEVLVVGYAVYQGRKVFAALAENMERNPDLKVTLCLDVKRAPADTSKASEVVSRFANQFKEKEWPGKRLPDLYYDPRSLELEKGSKAALHAKCVVVDRAECFISSANFTEAAQIKNIEVGALIKEVPTSRTLVEYFEKLIETGTLERII